MSRVEIAIQAMKTGTPIILLDDDDRENEGDLIIAAEKLTHETMALLIRECSGIVCLCLSQERVEKLNLPQMVTHNESRFRTAFTVSIEARKGVTTGVSAADRLTTIQAAIADNATPHDVVSPGHVFPLLAAKNGVLARRGHTEGAVDLARLAGLKPAVALCELMNPDGTMARGEQIKSFSEKHNFPILTIEELVQYRNRS
jgi:3,4-dihydroxy 2-butanone 4-phosphate synthase